MRRKDTGSSNGRGDDRGFTLVELLIVIVILGILASVTVFAVRGVSAKSQDNVILLLLALEMKH